jgi:hypothetical protein
MRNNNQHKFSDVPNVEIPRSTFNRGHGYKTTFDAGYLVPFFVDMALPGDTFQCNVAGFSRLATPIYPIMDNMYMETFFFSVPIRLVWENFKKFMGEQVNPGDSIDYTVPIVDDLLNASNETIWDYFGLPTLVNDTYEFNALVPRSYNLIYNEWFRDENLQDSVTVNIDNGPDSEADYEILKRGKRHDYFTSALPWLQKGDAVLLPMGDTAPVVTDGQIVRMRDENSHQNAMYWSSDGTYQYPRSGSGSMVVSDGVLFGNPTGLEADLSLAVGPNVNELRQAIQVQRLLERDARAGTRYVEILKSHFGVTSPDFRMQRPEYLGGGRTPVNISPIARTDSTPGELGAMGVSAFAGHGFVHSFTEHCVVIGLVNVRADLTYQEGIERHWNYQTRYDFYWPTLAHLGEQAILNKEIFIDAASIADESCEDVFGYQERYAELRYKPSRITGKFRSNDPASLDSWHLGIEFGAMPTLDDTFIVENPPIDRVIRVPSQPHFIFDSFIDLRCTRPMPTYSIPGLIDHF